MRRIFRLTAVVFLAVMGGLSAGAWAQQSMSLPEVTVTAPANKPAPAPVTKTINPYFGNTRVEEDKWPDIPCAASSIALAVPATCKKGPPQVTFEHGDAQGNRLLSNCKIAHDLVMNDIGHLTVEAEVLIFDPNYVSGIGFQRQDCYVEAGHGKLSDEFPDMNRMTRQGTDWRNFVPGDDLTTMEFTLGTDDCMALEKRGPRWGGGYVNIVHAAMCRKDGQKIDSADVTSALGWLLVRQAATTH